MKQFNKVLMAFVLIAGVIFLAVPTEAVFAQSDDPPSAEGAESREPISLEEHYAKAVERYEQAGERMGKADEAAIRLEARIEELIEVGEDPSELQAILAIFEANGAAVEVAYAEVGVLIADHTGFNDAGEVVDEGLAVVTLRRIAEGLLDVHQLREDARFELRWDLMAYRYNRRNAD